MKNPAQWQHELHSESQVYRDQVKTQIVIFVMLLCDDKDALKLITEKTHTSKLEYSPPPFP